MSKRVNNNYSGFKNVTSTPRRNNKQKSDISINPNNLFQNSKELKNNNYSHNSTARKVTLCETASLEQKEPINKTPKELLSFLLKNSIGKSLMKLEANTKEQEDTLKFIGKNFLAFEKNILTLKVGIEKKKKEDAKKKKLSEKKRSKTVQSNRRLQREYTTVNLGKNNKNNNLYLKTDSTFLKRKNDNLMDTPKLRSKTMRTSKSSYMLKSKKTNDLISTPKKSNMKIIKNNENKKGEETSRTTTKDNDNDIENDISQRQPLRSKSRKRTSIANKEREKSRKSISRSKSKRKSINNKNKMTDEKNEIKNNINNLKVESERDDSPKIIKKEPEISKKVKFNDIDTNENKKKDEESYNLKNVLKELEDNNRRKPKIEEEKDTYKALRLRSRSKNRDRRIGESNIDKEIKGSLIDVKHMLEGVSDVIDKIESDRKSRDKRKNDIINKVKINDDEKNKNNENNFSLKQSIIKFEKENQIMNDEIINTITNDKNIISNSILENNLNFLNKNDELNDIENNKKMFPIPESENDLFDSQIQISNSKLVTSNNNNDKTNVNNCKSDINNFIIKDINNNHEIKNNINDDKNNDDIVNKNSENINDGKYSVINNKKNENIDNNKVINNDNNINNDKKENLENLTDNNNLKKEETMINGEEKIKIQKEIKEETIAEKEDNQQILSQSAILSEKYILISRDPNSPFTIENALKFEKTECLGIIDFLNFQEKMEFTGINHGFIMERINILNNKKEEIIKSIGLSPNETINDLINEIRLKYKNDELSQSFSNYQINKGGSKAVELLNNDLYSNIFKKSLSDKKIDEICIVYRVLLALFGEYKICSISSNKLFWTKCTEYINEYSEGKIGTFILKKFNEITFEHKKIVLINKLLSGIKNNFNASYFSKICGTTGLLIFIIRDALEYCGVIINEKKTQHARMLDNLLYYKEVVDTLTNFTDSLSTFKTYKTRDKNQ